MADPITTSATGSWLRIDLPVVDAEEESTGSWLRINPVGPTTTRIRRGLGIIHS